MALYEERQFGVMVIVPVAIVALVELLVFVFADFEPATLIGFHNTRFREARLDASIDPDPTRGKRFEAFVISDPCPTFRRLA